MGTTQSSGPVNRIIQGLAQKPVYLFFFGVCFLAFGGGGAAAGLGAVVKNSSMSTAGVVVVGLALVCSVAVVFLAEREGQGAPGQMGDVKFDPVLQEIYINIRLALQRSDPVFRQKLYQDCTEFKGGTAFWSKGQLRLSSRDYNRLLTRAYEGASKEVFATTTADFLPSWTGLVGGSILLAHKTGKAKVKRVFIFDTLASVPANAIEEMKKQYQASIEVMVYGLEEDVNYTYPPDSSMRFAIIDDGEIIALTNPVAGQDFTGTFFFQEIGLKEEYKHIAEALQKGSISFQEFMAKCDPSWKPAVQAGPAATLTA